MYSYNWSQSVEKTVLFLIICYQKKIICAKFSSLFSNIIIRMLFVCKSMFGSMTCQHELKYIATMFKESTRI